jgi:hypothetical protein
VGAQEMRKPQPLSRLATVKRLSAQVVPHFTHLFVKRLFCGIIAGNSRDLGWNFRGHILQHVAINSVVNRL